MNAQFPLVATVVLMHVAFAPPLQADVCAHIDADQKLAMLSLYSGDCPGELEHDGVELMCNTEGELTTFTGQLFLFDRVSVGKLWQAGKPLTITFKQGAEVVSFDEQSVSVMRNDYLDDYSYELHASMPAELLRMLERRADISIEAPGATITLPLRLNDEAIKFARACKD